MRVGTYRLVIEFYDRSNELQRTTFSGISRCAVDHYLRYFRREYVVRSATVLDRPDGLVSF